MPKKCATPVVKAPGPALLVATNGERMGHGKLCPAASACCGCTPWFACALKSRDSPKSSRFRSYVPAEPNLEPAPLDAAATALPRGKLSSSAITDCREGCFQQDYPANYRRSTHDQEPQEIPPATKAEHTAVSLWSSSPCWQLLPELLVTSPVHYAWQQADTHPACEELDAVANVYAL